MIYRLRDIVFIGLAVVACLLAHQASAAAPGAAAPGCSQARVERLLGAPPPPGPSLHYIVPDGTVTPFYQWENNNGYCGEVSLMEAGLANGQWVSQYNTRLVCGGFFGPEADAAGESLQQAGIDPRKSGPTGNLNAQLLVETPYQGLTGPYDYDWAKRCATNAGLELLQYPSNSGFQMPNSGLAGYRDFMSWIKAQVIAGHRVAFGILDNGGSDPQYDHIVTVIKIGTNHAPNDPGYYPDDVIYFDDHGGYTLKRNRSGKWRFANNPGIPPGAGSDAEGCTPYIFAYSFASFVKTRQQENAKNAPAYAEVLPDANSVVKTTTGNDGANGIGVTPIHGPHNVAFAISGPLDPQGETVPVSLAILRTFSFVNGDWVANPADENSSPAAGYNYETPYIGDESGRCARGNCASNTQPAAMQMRLQATVHGLTAGTAYNLYEYDFPTQTGAATGNAAALAIPTGNFNLQSGAASHITAFVASGADYVANAVTRLSSEIVVFRAVPADAP
jgi:hypothetical protein